MLECDRHREDRQPLTVIGRAVERVDHPAVIAPRRAHYAALFAQYPVTGIAAEDRLHDVGFALLVGPRHHVVRVRFGLYPQVVAPEVGELDLPGALCEREDEIQEFVVHGAISPLRNTCRTAG